jgi:hypothetical protein
MITPEQFVRQFNNQDPQKNIQLAKIDPTFTSGLPSVIYDIDILSGTKSKPLPHLSSYQPVANDRVMVMGGVIIGKIGDYSGIGGDYAPLDHNHDGRYIKQLGSFGGSVNVQFSNGVWFDLFCPRTLFNDSGIFLIDIQFNPAANGISFWHPRITFSMPVTWAGTNDGASVKPIPFSQTAHAFNGHTIELQNAIRNSNEMIQMKINGTVSSPVAFNYQAIKIF